jgi:hypothetical protein
MAFADGNGTPSVVPPQSESFPQTYGEWSAQWWQYVLGIPDNPTPNENPLTDPTGAQCPVGQWGPVFFLVGTAGPLPGTAIRNKCEVPAEVGLFFPIINISCAVPEDGDSPQAIREFCSGIIDLVDPKSLSVTIDGKSVPNLKNFRASEFFSFTGAVPGVFEVTGCNLTPPPCYEGFRNTAFSDGYWVMLNPLPRGHHKIRFQGTIPSFSPPFTVDVTYNLKVK